MHKMTFDEAKNQSAAWYNLEILNTRGTSRYKDAWPIERKNAVHEVLRRLEKENKDKEWFQKFGKKDFSTLMTLAWFNGYLPNQMKIDKTWRESLDDNS